MMSWFGGMSRSNSDRPSSASPAAQKLGGYHELAKDALERAYQADMGGNADKAVRLYSMAVQAMSEGLALPVQGTGLGPMADTVSARKHELGAWQTSAQARLRYLESRGASTSSSGQGGAPGSRVPSPARPTSLTLMSAGSPPQGQGQGAKNPRLGCHRAAGLPRSNTGSGGGAAGSKAGNARPAMNAQRSGGHALAATAGGGIVSTRQGGQGTKEDDKFREAILGEMLDRSPGVRWPDIAGLEGAKQALQEAVILPSLRPDLFSGPLRAPLRGILLYGPPGNGKTMLGKALAAEARATFFSISASSLTSKWVGEGEKLMRALFAVAAELSPSIIFIDEIDSILGARGGGNEHDAARRLKTEFLVQIVIGATNRPQDLDDAVRRRLVKRVYIPMPGPDTRATVLGHLLHSQAAVCGGGGGLSPGDMVKVVRATEGYSASDLTALCKEAAMGPVRELGPVVLAKVSAAGLRPICLADFGKALSVIKPSTDMTALKAYEDWTTAYGTGG